MRPEGRDEDDAAAVAKYGKQLLHQEIRRADIDRKELIEILDRDFLDGRSFRDSGIGDKDVQAIADDAARLPGKLTGAVRGGEVYRYGIRAATGFAYLRDNAVGFIRAAAICTRTWAPAAASAIAVARPMPREAPVTRAVLPARLVTIVLPIASARRQSESVR